jgi:urocanate hydratase
MTSAGVTVIADGTAQAAERLAHALTNDTALGLIRYADAGYPESLEEIEARSVPHIHVG